MKGNVGSNAIHRDPHHFFSAKSIFAGDSFTEATIGSQNGYAILWSVPL